MMNKIPTAEEFRVSQCISIEQDLFNSDLHELMIEFAKLHVKAALEIAANNLEDNFNTLSAYKHAKESIINTYPDENIK